MPSVGSAQRLRVGAELRRLRQSAGLSGEQVARALGWSQPKVSRVELGTTAFTVKDVAGLLALYGATDEVRAELLAAVAEDTGESAWIIRAGGYPRRQGSIASLESVAVRIRHFQPVVVSGLMQTPAYARAVITAAGSQNVEAGVEARMRRQEIFADGSGPRYDMILDARALLLGVAPVDVIRDQILSLADRAEQIERLDFRIIPLGREAPAFSAVGFTVYEFRSPESPPVAWIEAPAGDVYFSAPDDVTRHIDIFEGFRGVALSPSDSVNYLRSLAGVIDRYLTAPGMEGGQS